MGTRNFIREFWNVCISHTDFRRNSFAVIYSEKRWGGFFSFLPWKEVWFLTHMILNASRSGCPTSRGVHFLFSSIEGLKQWVSSFEFIRSWMSHSKLSRNSISLSSLFPFYPSQFLLAWLRVGVNAKSTLICSFISTFTSCLLRLNSFLWRNAKLHRRVHTTLAHPVKSAQIKLLWFIPKNALIY